MDNFAHTDGALADYAGCDLYLSGCHSTMPYMPETNSHSANESLQSNGASQPPSPHPSIQGQGIQGQGNQDNSIQGKGLAVWVATGLGVGLIAPAPGTVGGLWGLPLAWAIVLIPSLWLRLAVIVIIGLASVPICTWAARRLGASKDPGAIVLDEIASVPIVFCAVPALNLPVWIVGYLLLRLFDISKPPPVNLLERLPSGWGIMADDMMAGIYAALSLQALLWCDAAAGIGLLSCS